MSLLYFSITLAVLIAVHEYGHYCVAKLCGVRVLQFSLGLGPVIWRRSSRRSDGSSDTEFLLCAVPLGGFVRMLDSRETEVQAADIHLAFDRQSLWVRCAVVLAGPLANLMLAVVLMTAIDAVGVGHIQPILSAPVPQSLLDKAGLRSGDRVVRAGTSIDVMQDIRTLSDLHWMVIQAGSAGESLLLDVVDRKSDVLRTLTLDLSVADRDSTEANWLHQLGFQGAWMAAVLADVMPGGAAQKAGLRKGDLVKRVDGRSIEDAASLRSTIRQWVKDPLTKPQIWEVQRRGDSDLLMEVRPEWVLEAGLEVGHVGARIGEAASQTVVRYGVVESFGRALERTVAMSWLSLQTLARMVMGQASWQQLSGPVTMAEQAGQSAARGWAAYFYYLSFISIGLAVFNLLPIPMLDGGHLVCYLWEGLTGSAPPERWLNGLQKLGFAALIGLMSVALFNDVARWLF